MCIYIHIYTQMTNNKGWVSVCKWPWLFIQNTNESPNIPHHTDYEVPWCNHALERVLNLVSITVTVRVHKAQPKLNMCLIAFLKYDLQFRSNRTEVESTVTPTHAPQPSQFKKLPKKEKTINQKSVSFSWLLGEESVRNSQKCDCSCRKWLPKAGEPSQMD